MTLRKHRHAPRARLLLAVSSRLYLHYFLTKLDQILPSSPARFLNDDQRPAIMDEHKEDNGRLADATGIDLQKYGYY